MISGARTTKGRGRPLAARTVEIREAILALVDQYDRMTVRGVFYKLEQVTEWRLPTRPPNTKDPEAAKWGDLPAVELDAADPEQLTALVDEGIAGLVDHRAWEVTRATEHEERAGLLRLAAAYEEAA